MHVVSKSDNRIKLESDTHFAVVSREYEGTPREQWLLTAFEKRNSASDNTMDTGETPQGKRNDTATPQNTISDRKGTTSSSNTQDLTDTYFSVSGNRNDNIRPAVRQEMDDIKAKTQANGTFMKAPNGKKSELNETDQVMHSVNITGPMRESVMQGQPMFSISGKKNDSQESLRPNETKLEYAQRVAKSNQSIEEKQLARLTKKFNEELQQQIDGTLPANHIYQLGRPSTILKNAGVADLPIELSAERLGNKSEQENHPFDLNSVKGLPKAINNPIAVFDSRTKENSKVILTELKHGNNNFVVILSMRKSNDKLNVDINSIRSLYPKDSINGIVNWFKSGLLRYADTEKLNGFLTQSTNLIASEKTEIMEIAQASLLDKSNSRQYPLDDSNRKGNTNNPNTQDLAQT